MRTCLDRVLLGGQSEGIETQGVQNITPRHPVVTCVYVGSDVSQRVAYMQAFAGWVGKHVLDEHLVGGHLGTVAGRQRTDWVGHIESP